MSRSEPIASATSAPSGDADQRIRGPLAALCLTYAVFVVYGSLVPLDFTPVPWDRAWHAFRHIPFLHLGIASRADWVANVLLFIPLGFLTPTLLAPGSRAGRWGATITVLIGCLLASLTIEFVQLFFPPRTVSQNDIMAESLGGLIGVIAGWCLGGAFVRWVTDWSLTRSPASLAERILWGYLAALLLYSVLPLDLTISPAELYHKWQQGLFNPMPFSSFNGDPVILLYALTTDALIWTPVSLLWCYRARSAQPTPDSGPWPPLLWWR